MPEPIIHIRTPDWLKKRLSAIAESRGLSLSAWVRMVLLAESKKEDWK